MMFFFFGCQIYDKMRKERYCLNEVVIYDPFNNVIDVKYPYHKPERLLVPRKNYAGFALYDTFYCHGGQTWMENGDQVLNSFIQVNMHTLEWKDVNLNYNPKHDHHKSLLKLDGTYGPSTIDMNTEYVYGHKMTIVSHKREFLKVNELGQFDYDEAPFYIKHEGVYMFGGVFGKSANNPKLSSKTFVF